jgi:hypothetical protein
VTELIESREDVVAKLYDLWLARQAKNEAAKVDAQLTEGVKNWLGLEGEDEIVDGERGIRAYIKEVGSTPTWDIRNAPDEVILFLAKDGVLTVNNTAFNSRRKNAPSLVLDDAIKYRQEGVNYQLRVEKKD